MYISLPIDRPELKASDVEEQLDKHELAEVFIDANNHIIAIFSDDTSLDVTALFDGSQNN